MVPFLSPESHWAATGGFARQILSIGYWQLMLETIRRRKLNAVLWLGGDGNFKHDFEESPDWWLIVEALLAKWKSEAENP